MKAKIVIGNIRCKKDYLPEEKAFHTTDVPDHAREARLHVKQWKRPPLLGVPRPTWSAETSIPRPLCERVGAQLIDTAKSRRRPQTTEESAAGSWNVSTVLDRKDWKRQVRGLSRRWCCVSSGWMCPSRARRFATVVDCECRCACARRWSSLSAARSTARSCARRWAPSTSRHTFVRM
jgi:hypothetical protein